MSELRRFRQRLEEALGRVDHVILFGSRARNTSHEWSDVDLLVVSPAFEGKLHLDRAARVRRLWHAHVPVDLLCYTPDEFESLRGQVSIVRVALEEGAEVGMA
jgi:predicted nucleotidyltransferase